MAKRRACVHNIVRKHSQSNKQKTNQLKEQEVHYSSVEQLDSETEVWDGSGWRSSHDWWRKEYIEVCDSYGKKDANEVNLVQFYIVEFECACHWMDEVIRGLMSIYIHQSNRTTVLQIIIAIINGRVFDHFTICLASTKETNEAQNLWMD